MSCVATQSFSQEPSLILAKILADDVDVSQYLVSEKFDGVRAFWDGKILRFRSGAVVPAPNWFLAKLPKQSLDGELWLGRKAFQRTVSIVRRQDAADLWRDIKFRLFDAPGVPEPFEARIELLGEIFSRPQLPYVDVLPQQRCRNEQHLWNELAHIESLGGEGLMLRQPGSRYEAGRSTTLLKLKRFHDAEARVIGHQPGTGRHKGRLGALLAVLDESFSPGPRTLLFGTSSDKDARGMLAVLLPRFERIVLTRYSSNPRAVAPEKLDALATEFHSGPRLVLRDAHQAWAYVREHTRPHELIAITGSFFLAGELRRLAREQPISADRPALEGV